MQVSSCDASRSAVWQPQNLLLFPGEKLDDKEVDEVVKDCMDAEDDDGMIPYARKYFL